MGIVGLITNAGIHTTLACVLKSFGTPLNTDVANDLSDHRSSLKERQADKHLKSW